MLLQSFLQIEHLQRIKAEQETILYNNLSTVLGKANQMSSDNEFAGDPSYAITEAELLRAVTAEDVMRVYETYIKDKPAVVTSFVPQGEADLALEGAEKAEVWIEEVKADVAATCRPCNDFVVPTIGVAAALIAVAFAHLAL